MKLELHHINFSSTNVPEMDAFYRKIMDCEDEQSLASLRDTNQGYDGNVSFLNSNGIQVHLAAKDLDVAFRTKQSVNPLEKGHIAFRTDDIEAFKKRLEDAGIPYADYGAWAMNGWYQIFFYDPDGNCIEVHQVLGE